MDEEQWLAEQFEEHRGHLRAVAYRMLGSLTEADDAVQDTWLRLSRSGARPGAGPARVADHGRGQGLPEHAAGAERPARKKPSACACPPLGQHGRRVAAGTPGAAGRLARPGPAGRARHPEPGRAAGVCPARHVRPAVRGHRGPGGPNPAAVRQLASRARRRVKGAGVPDPDPDLARQREWSTPSSRPRGAATSMPWSRCSTPGWSCAPIRAPHCPRPPC